MQKKIFQKKSIIRKAKDQKYKNVHSSAEKGVFIIKAIEDGDIRPGNLDAALHSPEPLKPPELSKPQKTIAERVKLRRQRLDDVKEFVNEISRNEKDIDMESYKKHFISKSPKEILKHVYSLKSTGGNKELIDLIKSALSDLRDEIDKMSLDEIINKKSHKIV